MLITSKAAVEALHALYSRSNFEIEDFQQLVHLMYQTDHLTLLRKLYEWSIVDANDIDDTRYTISKKLSEVCAKSSHGFAPPLIQPGS